VVFQVGAPPARLASLAAAAIPATNTLTVASRVRFIFIVPEPAEFPFVSKAKEILHPYNL